MSLGEFITITAKMYGWLIAGFFAAGLPIWLVFCLVILLGGCMDVYDRIKKLNRKGKADEPS